jgi:hypothetical protein
MAQHFGGAQDSGPAGRVDAEEQADRSGKAANLGEKMYDND